MAVPPFDTTTPLALLRERIDAAIAGVLDSQGFILGPEVAAFEQEFAAYCGARHAIGVANGTDALALALQAMGVGPGDDVVVPSFTFYASAEAVPPTGARPVFCDVDAATFCVTPETVKAALTRGAAQHHHCVDAAPSVMAIGTAAIPAVPARASRPTVVRTLCRP